MKFTIAIPAYKATFLKECIESVLDQSYTDFELLILNDASPENIKSIVDQFSDSRINFYENEKNVGSVHVVDNWNKCLNLAKGEYIICMGDDDKITSNCLEEYDRLISKYPKYKVFHARTEIIDEESNFSSLQEARPEIESVYSMIWHRWKGREQFIGDFLFHTETLINDGGFFKLPLAWGSDDITGFIAASHEGIINSQKILFHYRINKSTITNSGSVKEKIKAIDLEEKWLIEFLKIIPVCDLDKKFRILLLKEKNKYLIKKKMLTIKFDLLSKGTTRILYWILKRKQYGISIKLIIGAYIDFLKSKNYN